MNGVTFLTLLIAKLQTNPNAIARRANAPKLQSALHRYLKGEVASPSQKTLEPAADVLGFNIEALFSTEVALREAKRLGLLEEQPSESLPIPPSPKPQAEPPASPASPSGPFDAITPDEMKLIHDFRFLLDGDKAEYQKQIAIKATAQREHLEKLWDSYGPKKPQKP